MKTLQATLLFMLLGLMMTGANAQISSNLALELNRNGTVAFARVITDTVNTNGNSAQFLQSLLASNATDIGFVLKTAKQDRRGMLHEKFDQTFKGLSVFGGQYIVHSRNGLVQNANGNFIPIHTNQSIVPTINEANALTLALQSINATSYKWQSGFWEQMIKQQSGDSNASYYPVGQLVIAGKDIVKSGSSLAWMFKVNTAEPENEIVLLIDAHNGKVLFKFSLSCALGPVTDSAHTMYSGRQAIGCTALANGRHVLKEWRHNGLDSVQIQTFDWRRINDTPPDSSYLFWCKDTFSTTGSYYWQANNWTTFKQDQQALDAHWGAEKAYDYWKLVHGRNSINDTGMSIISYAHASRKGSGTDAIAEWLDNYMRFGDGDSSFSPLTSLDVCGHEFGHGVTQYTAVLNFPGETNALSEGFSDIWGACLEHWAVPDTTIKKTWLLGEEIVKVAPYSLRNMRYPKLGKDNPSPDCYNSPTWFDALRKKLDGHFLNGVLNKWFYILSEGEKGTNDLGYAYDVKGIGIDSAAALAYLTEQFYLSNNAKYNDARIGSIAAAKNLFKDSLHKVAAVIEAWRAVGLDSIIAGPNCYAKKYQIIDEDLPAIGDTLFADSVYFIPTSIVIADTATFRNATVFVAAGATITVAHAGVLSLEGSRFLTCKGQWEGFNIENGGKLYIKSYAGKSSLIEDATIAVNYTGGYQGFGGTVWDIDNTIFNRNKVGINLTDYTNDPNNPTFPFQIKNTLFTSRKIAEDSSTVWPNVATVKNSGRGSAAYPATPLSYDSPYINAAAFPDALVPYTSREDYTPYPSAGIVLNNVNCFVAGSSFGTIKIGDNGGSGQPNTLVFDNLGVGIKATKTNLTVRNCTFQNPKNEGIGIQVANEVQENGASGVPVKYQYSLDISSDAGKPNNAFFGLNTAIHVLGGVKTTISHCDITSNQSFNDFQTQGLAGYNGIVVKSNYYDNTEISNNHLYNIRNGILFNNTMYWACTTDGINHGQLTVTNNTIGKTNPAITSTTGYEYVENAIVLSAINFSDANAANPVVCSNNTLTDVFNGVYLSQWSAVATHVDSNQVQLAAVPSNPNYEAFGICMEGSEWSDSASTIQNNQITGSYDYHSLIGSEGNQTGILLRMQSNTEVQCNTVSKNMNGFRFFGSNLQTKFWDNTMKADNLYGMTLDNGFIGQQGNNDANAFCPSNNNWDKDSSGWDPAKKQFMTFCNNSDARQSALLILPNIGKLNPNGSAISTNFGIPGFSYTFADSTLIPLSKDSNCTRCSGAASYFQTTTTVNSILEEIAQGIINLPADEAIERLYVMQEQLYRMLRENPDLSNSNFNLQQFMYANQWQSLDFIHYLGRFMSEGNFAFVNFLLNNWTGQQNEIDNNYSHYYEIVLTLATSPEWRPDMVWLFEMANRCPLTNGIIIYAYRNLYNSLTNHIHHFENNCDGALGRGVKKEFIRLKQPPVVKELQVNANKLMNPKSLLYPNPAQDYVTLGYQYVKQVSIYSTLEKLVYNKPYNDANNVIVNLRNLGKGVYLVKITGTDGKTRSEKLIIQ